MEEKLKILFDYQRFRRNERLEKLIESYDAGTAVALSVEDLSLVNAAGSPEISRKDMESLENYLISDKGRNKR